MAYVPFVHTLRPITRNNGTPLPNAFRCAEWVDNLVLAAAIATTYTLPTGCTILRISASNGDVWINFAGVAALPGANVLTGLGSVLLKTSSGPQFITVPAGTNLNNPSLFSVPGCTVSIEVWK